MEEKDYNEIAKIISNRRKNINKYKVFTNEEIKIIDNQLDGVRNDLAEHFEKEVENHNSKVMSIEDLKSFNKEHFLKNCRV